MWSASSVVPSRSRATTAGRTCRREAAAAIVWESLSEVDMQRSFAAQNWSTQQCGKKQMDQLPKRLMQCHTAHLRRRAELLLSCGDSTRAGFFQNQCSPRGASIRAKRRISWSPAKPYNFPLGLCGASQKEPGAAVWSACQRVSCEESTALQAEAITAKRGHAEASAWPLPSRRRGSANRVLSGRIYHGSADPSYV